MNKPLKASNCDMLERELTWFQSVLEQRFATRQENAHPGMADLEAPPDLSGAIGPYADLLRELALNRQERLLLILAMVPHLAPEMLDPFLLHNQALGRRFSEFGGVLGQSHAGFLPTIETALFLMAGANRHERIEVRSMFQTPHKLVSRRVVNVVHLHPDEPPTSAVLRMSREYLEKLLAGEAQAFHAGEDVPAERITTALDWDDLVLDAATRDQINMIGAWISHSHTLMHDWGLSKRIKPGYRCLFYGSPGTGKTMTACLLGKHHNVPVYRVDLSRIVSKWIGETEKNLAALFDTAQEQRWILFFDEAEALFGQRTQAHTANDRSANQQIAYLLQRLEDFPGTVILSTNQRGHMDEAFARRFQSTILFPVPDAASRLKLWESMFRTGRIALAADIDFHSLAQQHDLAGGAIINVLRYACLRAVVRTPPMVHLSDLMSGIKQELQKEGHYLKR